MVLNRSGRCHIRSLYYACCYYAFTYGTHLSMQRRNRSEVVGLANMNGSYGIRGCNERFQPLLFHALYFEKSKVDFGKTNWWFRDLLGGPDLVYYVSSDN